MKNAVLAQPIFDTFQACLLPFKHFLLSCLREVVPFHPKLTTGTDFLLPDRNDLFQPINPVPRRFEDACIAMCSGTGNQDCGCLWIKFTNALNDGNSLDNGPALTDFVR